MTVKEFIRSVRIKRAVQMLEQKKMTVSEVAYEVGFKDIAYFRRCFKNQTGKSPSDVQTEGKIISSGLVFLVLYFFDFLEHLLDIFVL
jgi:transcriptional regulator GlxA family with amidase domain